MVQILEELHSFGIVYNDIKSDNICVGEHGQIDPGQLKLIDFGLCTKYLDKDGKHLENKNINEFIGSFEFSSINVMEFKTHSRRDDLWQVFYFLVYLAANRYIFEYDES